MNQYLKAIAALLGGIAGWGITATTDGVISMTDWFGLVAVFATALGVFAVENAPAEAEPRDRQLEL